MIGDDIVVTVLDSAQNQVKIGISAPRDIAVHREEIYLRVKLEEVQGDHPCSPSNSHFQHSQSQTLDTLGPKS